MQTNPSPDASKTGQAAYVAWWVRWQWRRAGLWGQKCCFRLRQGRSERDVRLRRCTLCLIGTLVLALIAFTSLSNIGPPPEEVVQQQLDHQSQIINERIELPIITVATSNSMANLREFVGMVHRYCPRCPVTIYSYDLHPEQLGEVAKWERVDTYDVFQDLLLQERFYNSLNPVQLAIVHAMKTRHRLLYLNVNYEFTGTLQKIEEALRQDGYLLVRESNMQQHEISGRLQGYTKASQAYNKIAKAVASPSACKTAKKPCRTGKTIRLPDTSRVVHRIEDLPVEPQHLDSVDVKMRIQSEANANVDKNNAAYNLKPYHDELETYADTHRSYIRFDVSEITGKVVEAQLVLNCVWVADTNLKETEAFADLLFVTDNNWEERSIDWSTKPSHGDLISTWKSKTGDVVEVDVTEQVKAATLLDRQHYKRKVSFALVSRDWNWIKYYSRHNAATDKQPTLIVRVKGQGVGYRYIHTVHNHVHDLSSPDSEDRVRTQFAGSLKAGAHAPSLGQEALNKAAALMANAPHLFGGGNANN